MRKLMIDRRIEGSPASQFVQLMMRYGYNQDIDIELATITAALPDIRIKVDNMEKIELDKDDLIIDESLTARTENVVIDGVASTIEYPNQLNVGDRIIVSYINDGQTYVILGKAYIPK